MGARNDKVHVTKWPLGGSTLHMPEYAHHVPIAYGANGLLALPITSTPLFIAPHDLLFELAADYP